MCGNLAAKLITLSRFQTVFDCVNIKRGRTNANGGVGAARVRLIVTNARFAQYAQNA